MHTGAPMLVAGTFVLLLVVLARSFPLLTAMPGMREPGLTAWLAGTTLSLNWLEYDAAHYARDLHFPLDRLFSYAVPFLTLLLAAVAFGAPWRYLRSAAGAVALLVLICGLRGADPRYYRSWQFNADSRRFFNLMKAGAAAIGHPVVLCGPWVYATPFDYYRLSRDAQWLTPFEKTNTPGPECDYFIGHPKDYRDASYRDGPLRGFRIVAEDAVSGNRLAERTDHGSSPGR
jgi:hypothetical protein